MEIQWYPGHMAKAKRELREILPLLDLIIEVTDARLPYSGRNPELPALLGKKPRILLLNKADLADPDVTATWIKYYQNLGEKVLEFNAQRGENLSLLEEFIKREGERILKQKPTLRLGVAGVPNCGKSSVLNRLVRRSAARVGEKPGVTRGRQWVKRGRWEILDTPGLLWPKIENQEQGLKMALIGLIKPDLLNMEELVLFLLQWLQEDYSAVLREAYALTPGDDPLALLMAIGQNRGCLRKGGEVDLLRTANLVWNDFRAGRLGRLSLERP